MKPDPLHFDASPALRGPLATIRFRDAVHDPHRDDNEPRSAELAPTELHAARESAARENVAR